MKLRSSQSRVSKQAEDGAVRSAVAEASACTWAQSTERNLKNTMVSKLLEMGLQRSPLFSVACFRCR